MLWVIIALFVLSMMLLVYARIVNIDYNISLSVFRQQSANQHAFAGLAVVRDYYESNPSQLENAYSTMVNNDIKALYPSGVLTSESSLLDKYEVDKLYLKKDEAGDLYIYAEAKYRNATAIIRIKITDADQGLYGDIERLR